MIQVFYLRALFAHVTVFILTTSDISRGQENVSISCINEVCIYLKIIYLFIYLVNLSVFVAAVERSEKE